MGGEGGDGDAALGVTDDLHDGRCDIGFGGREAFAEHIGRIADEHIDAFIAHFAQALFVHPWPRTGVRSIFQSPE